MVAVHKSRMVSCLQLEDDSHDDIDDDDDFRATFDMDFFLSQVKVFKKN